MAERRFATLGRFSLFLHILIPPLIVVTLVIANALSWDAGGRRPAPLWWSGFMGAFGVFYAVRTVLLAHTVTLRSDGRV